MDFSMLWVSVSIVMDKHNVEINLNDDTRTYFKALLQGSLSQLNFQSSSSQCHSLKYDLHSGVL